MNKRIVQLASLNLISPWHFRKTQVSGNTRSVTNFDITRFLKRDCIFFLQDAIRNSSVRLDDEQKNKAVARETLANAERRSHSLQNALEESR